MPMDQKFTPEHRPIKKVKKFYAKPSENTVLFLRNFARTYMPVTDENAEESRLMYN